MLAFKGLTSELKAWGGYQFTEDEVHKTSLAKCAGGGFHCARDPLDCLTYFGDMKRSVYYLVEAMGDIHEDGGGTRLASTEMRLVKKLSLEEFVKHSVLYMARYPQLEESKLINREYGTATSHFAIVRGKNPKAKGTKGMMLGLAQEKKKSREIIAINIMEVDGVTIKENTYYNVLGEECLDEN